MKRSQNIALEALTRIELLVVLAVIVIMAAVLLTLPERGKQQRARRVQCANNLKHLGLAFRTWAIDHDGQFPAQASTNQEAAPSPVTSGGAFRCFQVMSNELGKPRLLVCPADTRVAARDLGPGFSNTNLSYFVGLDVDESHPQMFLAGDRNLTNGLPLQEGVLVLTPNRRVGWTHELHDREGNIAMADGSVQGWANSRLLGFGVGITNRLAMP